jgi:hypothetical protein
VPPPVPVAIAATTTAAASTAAALPSATAATTAALFGSIAALAVNRTVATRFKRYGRSLPATGADYGCPRAHTGTGTRTCAVTAFVGVRWCVTTARRVLLGLAAWLAASGRGVAALLKELLFSRGEREFLTAVATGK